MAEYKSRLVVGGPGVAQAPVEELNLFSALKQRYNRPGSPTVKVLNTLSIPSQIVSSMVREGVEREQHPGMPELSMGQAAMRGIANPETSYRDIEGVGTKTAVGLDIAIDPLWIVPGKAFTSTGSAVAKFGREALIAAGKKSPMFTTQASKVIKNFEKTVAGYRDWERLVEEPTRLAQNEVAHDLLDGTHDDLIKLVPDPKRRVEVLKAAEILAPVETEEIVGPFAKQWTSNEKKAMIIARKNIDKMEAWKTRAEIIDKEKAIGLMEKMGTSYVPHSVIAPKAAIISDLNNSIQKLEVRIKNKSSINAIMGKEPARNLEEDLDYLKKIREQIQSADEYPSESYIREVMRTSNSGQPSFTRERKVLKSLQELGASEDVQDNVLYAMLEKDVARNLHQSVTKTSRAVYRHYYVKNFLKYMRDNKVPFYHEKELAHLPPSVRGKGSNELIAVEGIDELKGWYGPRVLVQDLKDQIMSPMDPDRIKNSVSLARRINSYYRGWALSVPMTVMRNAVDSIAWRNAAGGMKPNDAQFIFRAGDIIKNHARGSLNKAEKLIYDDMVKAGVVRSNIYEETEEVLRHIQPRNIIQRWLDPNPSRNKYTRFFFDKGNRVEDVARGGMFLWRRSKGDTIQEASRHVNKWHIDYRYGLTNWERNVRDKYIPFLTFTRFNMPLALETLVMKPKLVAGAGHAMEGWEDIRGGPEPDFPLAGWMAEGTPLRWKYDPDSKNYFIQMLDNLWSFTDINKYVPGRALDELASMISPMYVRPYEVIKNHNIFMSRGRSEKVPVEYPGDKFDLLGIKIKGPFAKRAEYLIRIFRPLDEADKVLKAASEKYGDTAIERGVNVMNRLLIGKIYPVNKEGQLRVLARTTEEQLKAFRRAKKIAEESGDISTYQEMSKKEQVIVELRKDLGIK